LGRAFSEGSNVSPRRLEGWNSIEPSTTFVAHYILYIYEISIIIAEKQKPVIATDKMKFCNSTKTEKLHKNCN